MLNQSLAEIRPTSRLYPAVTLLAAISIFVIDTFTSLDIAIAVLYAVVVMVSANFLNPRGVITVSSLCMLLTLTSYAIVHGGSHQSGPLIRGLVSLCAIGVTTFLALKNQRVTQELSDQAALLNLTHDAIFVRGRGDVITYWNAGAEELYGWKREEAIGRKAADLLKTKFPISIEAINQQLHAHDRWQGEIIHTTRRGSELTVASRWSLQRDERGRPLATLETNSDVTEQKRAEDALHEARSELSHVTRVSTLGELTASIAHEVNQPLAAVVTNGEACLRWLLRDVPDLGEVRSSVERMIASGRRASEVVARLRALARKSEPSRTAFTLNDIVDDILPLVERELVRSAVELKLALDPGLASLLGDRVQMQQVAINLVVNAVQSMSEVADRRRTLVISSKTRADDAGRPTMVLEVADTGVGIDDETARKLFAAFYTTKPDGMGMGLSICRSIVEAHGGRITAAPAIPRGATFTIELPIQQEARA